MNKAVLISIRPEWCGNIANGEKTIEVRKTRPKLTPPFKCYIYVAKQKKGEDFWLAAVIAENRCYYGAGSIIGEFVCDEIQYADAFNFVVKEDGEKALEGSCIDKTELFEYLGWERGMPRAECTPFYRWHISELKIYDTPKELSEFVKPFNFRSCLHPIAIDCGKCTQCIIKRPPQSWCYVEEIGGAI